MSKASAKKEPKGSAKGSVKSSGMLKAAVAGFLLVGCVGAVFYMANLDSKGIGATGDVSQPNTPLGTASVEAASPDLTKVNPYEYLDLIPVGKEAPNFTVTTAQGKTVSLKDFKGKQNVVLVFYQGSFCGVCAHQLSSIQAKIDEFQKNHTEVLAVSADDLLHAKETVANIGPSFPIIPDPEHKIITSFGVANIVKHNIAYPSVYILDKKGVVRLSYADPSGTRLESDGILEKLKEIH